MKVIVTQTAFYNGSQVEPGSQLEVPDNFKASWAVRADNAPASKPQRAARQEPRALSQVGKDESKTFVQAHEAKPDLA